MQPHFWKYQPTLMSQPQVSPWPGLQAWICQDWWKPYSNNLQWHHWEQAWQDGNPLYWGLDPWDSVCWSKLQVRLQLFVAIQVEHSYQRKEKEDQPLCRGWWLWQQRIQDWWVPEKNDLIICNLKLLFSRHKHRHGAIKSVQKNYGVWAPIHQDHQVGGGHVQVQAWLHQVRVQWQHQDVHQAVSWGFFEATSDEWRNSRRLVQRTWSSLLKWILLPMRLRMWRFKDSPTKKLF